MNNFDNIQFNDEGMLEYIRTIKNSGIYSMGKEYSTPIDEFEQSYLKKIRIKKLNKIFNNDKSEK